MAFTVNCNRTGRAASTEHKETKQYILDMQLKAIREKLQDQENNLMLACMGIEGEESFLVWWENDENVPVYGTIQERIQLLGEHLTILEEHTLAEKPAEDK